MYGVIPSMKRLLLTAALAAAVIAPTAASAAEPTPATSKNAAKYCKALKAASATNNFVSMFGTKKNAYGKCVSQTAKKTAAEDAEQSQAAKSNAAKECKAEGLKGREYGKCVSTKAKAKKAAADKEDEAQEDDRINAAQSCKRPGRTTPSSSARTTAPRRTPSASASPRPPRRTPPSARPTTGRPLPPRSTAPLRSVAAAPPGRRGAPQSPRRR